MIKSELIAILAAKRGISEEEAKKTIESLFDIMLDAMSDGDTVKIAGFGVFEVTKQEAHSKELNSKVMNVPERYKVKFRISRDKKKDMLTVTASEEIKNLLGNINFGD